MVVIESVCLCSASRVSFSSLPLNSKSILACMQTLFNFPFRSFAKLPQVREQGERIWSARKTNKFFSPHLCPLVLVVSRSPAVYDLSCVLNRHCIENREAVNRLNQYGHKYHSEAHTIFS